MNRKYKVALAILVMIAFLSGNGMLAKAAGTTSIAVSKSSLEVGGSVNVTVQASESATMNVKYNSGVLTFASCDASGYTTSGNVVTFTGSNATIKFNAAAEGKSAIVVSSDTVSGSSTPITVSAASADNNTTSNDTAANSNTTGQFTVDGVPYVVSERYASSEIPAGFNKTKLSIAGGTYNELSNGTMTLVYLKPASNTRGSGTFYIYNESDNSVAPFTMIGTMEHYVILLTPDSKFMDRLQEATCTIDEKEISMYQIQDGTATDFYYAYGVNQNGTQGWFQYDVTDGSIQRVNTDMVTVENAEDEETPAADAATSSGDKEKLKQYRLMIAGLIFLLVAFLIVIINLKLSSKKIEEDDNEDTDRSLEEGERAITLEEATAESDAKLEEEEAVKMSRKERRIRRRLEEDIFADIEESVPEKVSKKKEDTEDNKESKEAKSIEVLDLNDL